MFKLQQAPVFSWCWMMNVLADVSEFPPSLLNPSWSRAVRGWHLTSAHCLNGRSHLVWSKAGLCCIQPDRHVCPGKAGCTSSKAQWEWREEGRKGIGGEEPCLEAMDKSMRASSAVSDKSLQKDLKAVKPGYGYLLEDLYTNIFLAFISIHLLFKLQRSKLYSSKHMWTKVNSRT